MGLNKEYGIKLSENPCRLEATSKEYPSYSVPQFMAIQHS